MSVCVRVYRNAMPQTQDMTAPPHHSIQTG